jgi:hypothetical protein
MAKDYIKDPAKIDKPLGMMRDVLNRPNSYFSDNEAREFDKIRIALDGTE